MRVPVPPPRSVAEQREPPPEPCPLDKYRKKPDSVVDEILQQFHWFEENRPHTEDFTPFLGQTTVYKLPIEQYKKVDLRFAAPEDLGTCMDKLRYSTLFALLAIHVLMHRDWKNPVHSPDLGVFDSLPSHCERDIHDKVEFLHA